MHLSRLSLSDMLLLSQTYLDPNDPAHQALAGVPEVASLLSRLREAHQVLLASQSQDEIRASSLQKDVYALDAEQEDLVQGIDCLCQAMRLLIEDDELRTRWERLHQLMLPGGRKMAKQSYQAAAGNAALLQQILDGLPAADRQLLKAMFVGGRSLLSIIERWITVGKELGEKEQERLSLPIAPTDDALHSAKNQWIRIVGAMVAMFQMSELLNELPSGIKQHVLVPLRTATERGAPRRASGEPSGNPATEPRPPSSSQT